MSSIRSDLVWTIYSIPEKTFYFSFGRTRKDAISSFMSGVPFYSWQEAYRVGYRAIKGHFEYYKLS